MEIQKGDSKKRHKKVQHILLLLTACISCLKTRWQREKCADNWSSYSG